jgi:molybdopterin/thiamine biosynthesis adenylyltransferase
VGHLRIIDPDRVEETNLHRQTLYRMADLGQPKAEVAARELAALNPDCQVSARVARLEPGLARGELPGCDLVVDAADAFAVTYALSDLCHAAGKPLVSASVLRRGAQLSRPVPGPATHGAKLRHGRRHGASRRSPWGAAGTDGSVSAAWA